MYIKRQIFFVFGLSRSGKSAAEFLLKEGACVYVYDEIDSDRIRQTAEYLEDLGAKRIPKEEVGKAPEMCDVLVLSPGIPIDHPMAIAFRRKSKAIIGESELAARYMRCPVVAITGTNGKTTTVTMLTEVLKKSGANAVSCGNIGLPMLDCVDMQTDIAVAEISSFQLETLNSLRPHIVAILNITEDHLNRHYTMENYIFLKAKLLKNLTETEFVVLNYDDPIVRKLGETTKAKVLYFSVKERVFGAYFEKGNLYFCQEKILSADNLLTTGLHNIQNALVTIIIAKLLGVKSIEIAESLTSFKGVRHRIECVATIDGVQYINDSKGTNVDATIKAISTIQQDCILLLGGKDKGYDYDKLFSFMLKTSVVHAVVYGENRYALLKSARRVGFEKITICENFEFALRIATLYAQSGQTVLLSPASASFDEFAGYEERGDKFIEIVQEIKAKQGGADYAKQSDGGVEVDKDIIDGAAEQEEEET